MTPYFQLMRLHQPTGIWLLLFPCWWAIAVASDGKPSAVLLLLFAIGAVVMRAAGCIVNDMADRKFDALVERTKHRPLASGAVTMPQAFLLLFGLLCIALMVAILIMQKTVIMLAIISLFLAASYPFMKRITWYPQAFLGLTFNFGTLMGWAAVKGTVEWSALYLYLGGIFWTLGYDTIYGHQDKTDDVKIGVKSTALRLGENSKKYIAGFYALAIAFWAFAGSSVLYYVFLALVAAHFSWQLLTVNLDNSRECGRIFRSNAWAGLLLFLGTL